MASYKIDINADLGEGGEHDALIMPLISSCSIACGGHFGNEKTMKTTIQLAKKQQVRVGAHPSFPDKNNFGRTIINMTKQELEESIFEQLTSFYKACTSLGVAVHHIKLHGALYNYAAKDAATSDAVVAAIVATKVRPKLYVPYYSVLHKKAENLIPLVFEAFIDRAYNDDLSLVTREHPLSVLQDPKLAWEHLKNMVVHGKVKTISGLEKNIVASTYCIHGDNMASIAILNYLKKQLSNHAIKLS